METFPQRLRGAGVGNGAGELVQGFNQVGAEALAEFVAGQADQRTDFQKAHVGQALNVVGFDFGAGDRCAGQGFASPLRQFRAIRKIR